MKKYMLLCALFCMQACSFGGFSMFAIVSAMASVVCFRKSGSYTVLLAVLLLQLLQHTCWAEAGEITLHPQNQSVPLGETATFSCETYGITQWIVNDTITVAANGERLNAGLRERGFMAMDIKSGDNHTTTLTVPGTRENNNTRVFCRAILDGRTDSRVAKLLIYGPPDAPVAPKVDIISNDSIRLRWNRPFSFGIYPITNFTVSVRDHPEWNTVFTDNLNTDSFFYPISAEEDTFEECEVLMFFVTAMNEIGASAVAVAEGGFPIDPQPADVLFRQPEVKFTTEFLAEVTVCIKLPYVCPYQMVRYDIIVDNGRKQKRFRSEFSPYANYTSGMVEVTIYELQINTDYIIVIEIHHVMNDTVLTTTSQQAPFKTTLPTQRPQTPLTGAGTVLSKQDIFIISGAGAGGLLLCCVVLIIIVAVAVRQQRRHRLGRSRRPSKSTNPPPMVANPIYEGNGPVYETIDQRFGPNGTPMHYTPASSTPPLNNAVLNTESPYTSAGCVDPAYAEPNANLRGASPEDSYTVMMAAGTTGVGKTLKDVEGGESSLDFNGRQAQIDETIRYVPEPGTIQISEC